MYLQNLKRTLTLTKFMLGLNFDIWTFSVFRESAILDLFKVYICKSLELLLSTINSDVHCNQPKWCMSHEESSLRTDIGKSWKVWTFEVRLERWWLDWIINLVPIPRIGLVNKVDTLSEGNFLFQLSSNSLHRKEGTQKWMQFRFIVIENSNL